MEMVPESKWRDETPMKVFFNQCALWGYDCVAAAIFAACDFSIYIL